jgi:hypothetical protein
MNALLDTARVATSEILYNDDDELIRATAAEAVPPKPGVRRQSPVASLFCEEPLSDMPSSRHWGINE